VGYAADGTVENIGLKAVEPAIKMESGLNKLHNWGTGALPWVGAFAELYFDISLHVPI
jgi:hypothetical protein